MKMLALSFPDLALWVAGSAILVWLLLGAMHRRRQHLTELLRKHVETKLGSPDAADDAGLGEKES